MATDFKHHDRYSDQQPGEHKLQRGAVSHLSEGTPRATGAHPEPLQGHRGPGPHSALGAANGYKLVSRETQPSCKNINAHQFPSKNSSDLHNCETTEAHRRWQHGHQRGRLRASQGLWNPPPDAPPPRPGRPGEPSTHPLLQALPLLQRERVSFRDDRHNVHLVVYRLHKCNIQGLKSKSHV